MAGSLGVFVLVVWGGLLIQGGVVLPLLVRTLGKQNPWRHISKMSTGILTAFSTCSSLVFSTATLYSSSRIF